MARRKAKLNNRYTIGLVIAVLIIAVAIIVSFTSGNTGKFFYTSPTKTATYNYQPTNPVKIIPTQPIKTACVPAAEVCDGIDNNCNGLVDDGLPLYWHYIDGDHDGYGTNIAAVQNCNQAAPQGMINQAGDCNDNDNTINPAAPEVCNGVDDNCDGRIDEGFQQSTYYVDNDKDGYGGQAIVACSLAAAMRQANGASIVAIGGDCNDNLANINPGQAEICGDGVDNNCNGLVDENCAAPQQQAPACTDNDGDGYGAAGTNLAGCRSSTTISDCNDHNANVYPGAQEICNGLDDNCNGLVDETFDNDHDGYFFGPGCGMVYAQQDCNDNDPTLYPGHGCP